MMDMKNLGTIEELVVHMYQGTDANARTAARERLMGFENSPSFLPHCRVILENSRQPLAHMLAATSMAKLLTDFWNSFNEDQIIELRDFIFGFVANNLQSAEKFVLSKLVQVICRISKLGWSSGSQRFRDIKDKISKFFQSSASLEHYLAGLQFFAELVREMNQQLRGTAITAHRRVAVSFRDECLQHIFTFCFKTLNKVHSGGFKYSNPKQESQIILNTINLLHACLTYDYIGTDPDEATEEFFIIQIPGEWKEIIDNPQTSLLLFQTLFSKKSHPKDLGKLMEVIVLMISVRRSIFPTEESRLKFLTIYCEGCCTLLTDHRDLLQNAHIYTQLCRLLVGIKNNYQLDDLTKIPCYQQWIQKAAEFTMMSFKSIHFTEGSVHFIIQLWARLCMAIPFLRNQMPVYLNEVIPNIFEAFVTAQLDRISKLVDGNEIDEIYNKGDRDFQLRHLPYLARWNYKRAHDHVISLLQPRIQNYEQGVKTLIQNPSSVTQQQFRQLQKLETELSWLFYVSGSMLSSIMSHGNTDSKLNDLKLEAHLCSIVFQVTRIVNARLERSTQQTPPNHFLDESLLYVFGQFRQNYIRIASHTRVRRPDTMCDGLTNEVSNSRRRVIKLPPSLPRLPPLRSTAYSEHLNEKTILIYKHMSTYLGNTVNQDIILAAIVEKIIANLKNALVSPQVIQESLALLHLVATGFSSSQVLTNSDVAKKLLQSHGVTNFPFMTQIVNLKQRSLFYEILTMILMQEEHVEMFDEFMKPFEETFAKLEQVTDYKNQEVCITGVGLARDLTGCLKAFSNSRGYLSFFEWLYPRYFRIFLRMFEPWWDHPFVCIPMLKFISNLTHQKYQRIDFAISSPNGILLFQEISKVLVTYGNRVLSAPEQQMDDPYKER